MVRHLLLTLDAAELSEVSWREVQVSVIARSMEEVLRHINLALREQGVVRAVSKLRLLVWQADISAYVPLQNLQAIDATCAARVKVVDSDHSLGTNRRDKPIDCPNTVDLRKHERHMAAEARMHYGEQVEEEIETSEPALKRKESNYTCFCCCFIFCWRESLHVGEPADSGSKAKFQKDLAKQRKTWGPDPYYDENGKLRYNHPIAGDVLHYVINEHPVLGMFFANHLHPFSKPERVVVIISTLAFSFFSSTIVKTGSYNMSTSYALGVSGVGYLLKELGMIEAKLPQLGEKAHWIAHGMMAIIFAAGAVLAWQGLENVLNDFGECAFVASDLRFNQSRIGARAPTFSPTSAPTAAKTQDYEVHMSPGEFWEANTNSFRWRIDGGDSYGYWASNPVLVSLSAGEHTFSMYSDYAEGGWYDLNIRLKAVGSTDTIVGPYALPAGSIDGTQAFTAWSTTAPTAAPTDAGITMAPAAVPIIDESAGVDGLAKVCPTVVCNSSYVSASTFREHLTQSDKFVWWDSDKKWVTKNESYWSSRGLGPSTSSRGYTVSFQGGSERLQASCKTNGCSQCFAPGDIKEVLYVFAMQQFQSWILIWPALSGMSFLVFHTLEVRKRAADNLRITPELAGDGQDSPRTSTWKSPVKAELDNDRIVPIGAVLYSNVETRSVQRLTMSV
jgi:hypothetical protein